MNTMKIKYGILAVCLLGLISISLPAFALTATSISTTTRLGALKARVASTTNPQVMSRLVAQSDKEITQRIASLNALLTRIQSIKRVSDTGKANIASQIQAQITDMNTLKAKIDADTDTITLTADLKSITADYRIYMLVVPQIQLVAAADRIDTIASDLATIGTKLQTRIMAAQTAGKDVSSLITSMNDIQSKLTDAETQAQNAVNGIISLMSDQGNQTTAAANTAALKLSRADIKTATTDLQSARNDAETIIKGVQAFHLKQTVATSTATSTQ